MGKSKDNSKQAPEIIDRWEVILPNGTKGQATMAKKPKQKKSTNSRKKGFFSWLFR